METSMRIPSFSRFQILPGDAALALSRSSCGTAVCDPCRNSFGVSSQLGGQECTRVAARDCIVCFLAGHDLLVSVMNWLSLAI